MKRAIVTFVEDKNILIKQALCLYASLKEIGCDDTDLIVFGPGPALNRIPDDCVKVLYNPISYQPKWKSYHFINSVSCLADVGNSLADKYDLFLRCDADTFVTPGWNDYFPYLYTTGRGGYVNDEFTKSKIESIARSMGLRHRGIFNIGSTHYGNAGLVTDVCKLTVDVAEYILENEFSDGEGRWPGWYRGVTLLYAAEIATNHLVDDLIIDGGKLDFGSTSAEPPSSHPHIHCWHTDNLFSKFHFDSGSYDNINMDELDATKINEYCLYVALKSRELYKE